MALLLKILIITALLGTQMGEAFGWSAMSKACQDHQHKMNSLIADNEAVHPAAHDMSQMVEQDDTMNCCANEFDTMDCCSDECNCPMAAISLVIIPALSITGPRMKSALKTTQFSTSLVETFLEQPQRPPEYFL